ncbi:MAG TPA: PAS domain S-box protein [Desulfuromonadales bacterium]|nr:PAS domain S-box protein [Desulfuromonadales bacterium]
MKKTASESGVQASDEIRKIHRYSFIGALLWTVLLSGLYGAYVIDNRDAILDVGRSMAQVSCEKDILFRRWAARHGGVYAPVTADTPANPYLKNVPEREITTPSGRLLTLINPAYMSRQIFELARETPDIPQGHITSLNPIRPENAPDAWEAQALKKLEQGAHEVVEPMQMNGQPYLRFMRPLVTEKPCLRCHAAQGYKEGDGRGGISVTLSLAQIQKSMNHEMLQEALIHSLIWLVGLGFLWFGTTRVTGITHALRDERNNLRESEERFRSLADTAPVLIWIADHTKKFTYVNKVWCDFTGREEQELLGDGWIGDIHPDDRDRCIRMYESSFAARLPFSMEFRLRRQDGEYRWVVDTAVPRWLNKTDFIGYIGSCIDISERKLAEEKLAESENHLRTILDNEPECIKILDEEGLLMQMNPAGLTMIEADSLEQVAGHPVTGVIASEYHEEYMRLHRDVIAGATLQMEYEIVGLKGGRRWVETHAVPIQEHGRVVHLAVTRDIHGRKRAERERIELLQQFHHAQKLESLGVIAGGIAHDFNNILTVILGHCYMARNNTYSGEENTSVFRKIETAASRAADLCRQMLTYAGKSPMVRIRINLWLLTDEVIKMLQAAITKNVAIELDLNQRIPKISGDPVQIQQIVMNLIINAAEAIGDAHGTIRVALTMIEYEADTVATDFFGTAIRGGRYACLEVTDSGCGMSEETLQRIFEPFYTTKFTGRGLGMSAIHGIIASHDAILQLTSTPGIGTSFRVSFPVPDAPDATEAAAPDAVALEKGTGTILLVEDEKILRDMGQTLLELLGFTAVTAENGLTALEIYRERQKEIDLVLLDLIMPLMGGIEAYHALRKISPTLPIIICSGYDAESVDSIIKNDLHADFMHKPYKPAELNAVMVRMMRSVAE